MGDVLSALNVISGASPAVLQSLQTHGSFASALSKLNGSKSKTGAVDRLLQDLRESLPDIEKYLGKDPTAAVGSPPWQQKDRRLTDIQVVTNRDLSQQTRFRAFLAYRSFALEFDAWQRQTKAPSRVNRLAADVSRSRQIKGGQINMFIAANGYPRKETGTAITCGTKILIVERLVGHHGISALLAFQPRNFGRLKYSDLPELGSSLGAAGESEGEHRDNSGLREPKGDNEDARGGLRGITRLAEESSEFLDTCQTIYNGEFVTTPQRRKLKLWERLAAMQRVQRPGHLATPSPPFGRRRWSRQVASNRFEAIRLGAHLRRPWTYRMRLRAGNARRQPLRPWMVHPTRGIRLSTVGGRRSLRTSS